MKTLEDIGSQRLVIYFLNNWLIMVKVPDIHFIQSTKDGGVEGLTFQGLESVRGSGGERRASVLYKPRKYDLHRIPECPDPLKC